MDERIVCRILTGPTASGKSDWGLRMAEEQGWVIVCMDSMQIYRGMDIGTAKPTREERARVPHRMIDICDPRDAFSVAAYREQAEALVRQKAEEGREVLFVGGTGLYLQAMMHPMGMGSVPADETLRAELRALAATEEGKNRLHGMLAEIDPATAAIEVTRGTGIPFSMQPDREEESPFLWRVAATEMPREILYDRINRRVEQMIREGLAEEVRRLLEAGVPPESQSMQGLGYKEMVPYLRGEWPMDKAVEEIQKGSRHYAKRQGTFLRRLEGIQSVDALAADAAEQAETILA